MKNYATGNIVKGRVATIMPYGIFVTIDGADSLLHVSQMPVDLEKSDDTEKMYTRLSSLFCVGDPIVVEIIDINFVLEKLTLSRKNIESNQAMRLLELEVIKENQANKETLSAYVQDVQERVLAHVNRRINEIKSTNPDKSLEDIAEEVSKEMIEKMIADSPQE